MNYCEIKKADIADGPGVRVTLFVSGCRRHCQNCQNQETWNFDYGKLFSKETEDEILEACSQYWIAGLTLCGGEPFEPENEAALVPLVRKFRESFPEKTVWAYTGFWYEVLLDRGSELLKLVDVLVDGPYVDMLRDVSLRFKGSSNQRLVALKCGEIVGVIG